MSPHVVASRKKVAGMIELSAVHCSLYCVLLMKTAQSSQVNVFLSLVLIGMMIVAGLGGFRDAGWIWSRTLQSQ